MKQSNIILSILLLLAAMTATAQNSDDYIRVDLDDMYRQIDEAISQSPRYIANYEKQLDERKEQLKAATTLDQKLMLLMDLGLMYEPFNGDSTLAYTDLALQTARQGGIKEIEQTGMARLAYLCTFLGSQTECLTLLGRMQPDSLTHEARCTYYRAAMMAYRNLSTNTQLPEMRQEFQRLYQESLDSLLSTANDGSELYLGQVQPRLVAEGKFEEALKVNDRRLNQVHVNTHESAIVAYSRYQIYREMGNMEMAKYWLCQSAIDDVTNAVMDQMSLIDLADLLNADGDHERANRYITFTWECNQRFSPHMRSWQIAPLLSVIERNYQAKLDSKGSNLSIWAISASLLLVITALSLFFVYKKEKALKAAKSHMEKVIDELKQNYHKMEWMKEWAEKSNTELLAINKNLEEQLHHEQELTETK